MKIRLSNTTRSISRVVLILLILLLSAAGCGRKNISNETVSNGLESGLKHTDDCGGCEIPSDHCAYKSEQSEFDLDNVVLTFYYGTSTNIDAALAGDCNYYSYAELYFMDDNDNLHFIKRTEESYTSEEYSCKWILDDSYKLIGFSYNHSENIKIPPELFTQKSGRISFCVYGEDINAYESAYSLISIINIYYKTNDEKVILSSEPFE